MLKARVGLCVGFHAGHGAYFQRGKKKKKDQITTGLGGLFQKKQKMAQKDSNKGCNFEWTQFWQEKSQEQSTTGMNARMGLILTNDLQEGTPEYLQSTDCTQLCQR